MRLIPSHAIGRAAAVLGLMAGLALPQSDPLVSKSISRIFAGQDGFWVFSGDRVRFSRIDPFKNPLDIRNGALEFNGPMRGGVGRKSTALIFFGYAIPDSLNVGGVASLGQDGKAAADTLAFYRPAGQKNTVAAGVELSALFQWHDTVIVGGGYAGIALAKADPEGAGALAGDSLIFRALPEGEDTAAVSLRCALNARCAVGPITAIAEKVGFPDSVAALAVDSASADSVWLLIGTHTGLRRGLLSGNRFEPVALPTAKPGAAIRIERLHADAARGILWAFSGSEYFYSGDHGRTFHKPTRPSGVASAPDSLTGFTALPEAVGIGDTTFVNFNLDNPGLVLFRKDTVLANSGSGDFADLIFDEADGLPIRIGKGRLTGLAAVTKSGLTALAVGSSEQGLFLRRSGGSAAPSWVNVNSLKALKGGLEEIITFPTLYSGIARDGGPEYVKLGYRLKKDGKVTITVYNYAMEKVKTLVKKAPRKGGGNRSEVSSEDRWDGTDASGRHVSVGVYYILVESDNGEKGWGKSIVVHGRDP